MGIHVQYVYMYTAFAPRNNTDELKVERGYILFSLIFSAIFSKSSMLECILYIIYI